MCNWVLDVNFPLFVKLDPETCPLEIVTGLATLKLATSEKNRIAAIATSFTIEAGWLVICSQMLSTIY